jgi:hypothetical protein
VTTLPTQAEMFEHALAELDKARNSLSDARDWLNSDWRPVDSPLPPPAGTARAEMQDLIGQAKALIDQAKGEAYRALEVTGQ